MVYIKIVTHSGIFHADEILAIAFIHYMFGIIPIERVSEVSESDLLNPEILVLDIGKQFDVNLGNFDHHQQRGLEATNLLVLRNSFIETRLKDKLVTMLFQHVSDVDNGLKGFNESFYSLIRNFNNIANGFNVALEVTKSILEATIATAKKSIEGEARWYSLERVQFVVAINEGEFIPDWQVLADSNNIHFLASPNPRGGWQLTSRNSQEFLLKPSEFQTGIHPNLFIAFYKDKETCLQDAVIQVG